MEIALLIARLVLASVFAVAGLTKLSDRAGTRQVLIDFGVSPKLAPSVAVALPIAELVLAAGLLLTELAWAASLGVLVLLAGFSVAIAVNLAHGRRPDCRCFGRIAAAPIGWRTLARNVVLGLVALFVLSRGPNHTGYSAVAWFWERTSAEQIATLNGALALSVGGAAIWLLLQRDRRYNQLIGRMETLEVTLASRAGPIPQPPAAQVGAPSGEQPAGADAPTFELAGIDGAVEVPVLGAVADAAVVAVGIDRIGLGPGIGVGAAVPERRVGARTIAA